MIKREDFRNHLYMYFAVVEAYVNQTLQLQSFEIQELHKIFDFGQKYLHPSSAEYKKLKECKASLKRVIDEIPSGVSKKHQIPTQSVQIEYLFERIQKPKPKNNNDSGLNMASA